ncbi:MAG: hypothetical protein GVY12_16570 [Bacteroidetes bacterium]|nr:hypothetical protein [Bacteroidota bacterium]
MESKALLYVALGSAVGGGLRYAVALFTAATSGSAYPVATLFVNVVGSLIIGGIAGWLRSSTRRLRLTSVHLLGMTGLCGGFTTFKFFSWGTWAMLASGAYLAALAYVSLSVLLSLVAVWAGFTGSALYFLRRRSRLAA